MIYSSFVTDNVVLSSSWYETENESEHFNTDPPNHMLDIHIFG